ncbi:MFS transporter [Pseudonocardia sp. ICBG1293]|uniref:MFS transporter n=1 Tax=Pseudonocardia sp. ICBG1293 TaxID=2844382 RepID=UPI001CCEF616|nr:MFS transporter [Pseudonocardia sp. ICBG1293]
MVERGGSGAGGDDSRDTAPAGVRGPFSVPDFRALWTAEVLSVAGDQVARVALTVLVLNETGSVAWSAGVYALTFLPALLGGLLLGHLADRWPRRRLLIGTDLLRAGLVVAMAVPGPGLPVLAVLLILIVLLGGPHTAARSALLPDLLSGDLLARGLALRQVSVQIAQVVGFAGGGLLVATLTPRGALLVDAATFVLSAVVVAIGVRSPHASVAAGPAADPGAPVAEPGSAPATPVRWTARSGAWWRSALGGLPVVFGHPRRRSLALVAWMLGIFVLPEALAAAYAVGIGAGPAATGLLMAADPAGSAVGALVVAYLLPARLRERGIVPLAVGAALPLALTPLAAGLWQAVALWAVSGACATACLIAAQSGFARATPSAVRGSAVGVAASGLVASQGVAVFAGGILAEWTAPATALGVFGAVGIVLALATVRMLRSAGPEAVA